MSFISPLLKKRAIIFSIGLVLLICLCVLSSTSHLFISSTDYIFGIPLSYTLSWVLSLFALEIILCTYAEVLLADITDYSFRIETRRKTCGVYALICLAVFLLSYYIAHYITRLDTSFSISIATALGISVSTEFLKEHIIAYKKRNINVEYNE